METLLVLGILVSLTALAWPSFRGMWEAARIQSAAEHFRASLRQCRRQAVADGVPYRVDVRIDGRGFRTVPSSDPVDAGEWSHGTEEPGVEERFPSLRIEEELPEGCRFLQTRDAEGEADFGTGPSPGIEASDVEPKSVNSTLSELTDWQPRFEFFPDGSALEAVIAIGDEEGRRVVVRVIPLAGEVEISESRRESEALGREPIDDVAGEPNR